MSRTPRGVRCAQTSCEGVVWHRHLSVVIVTSSGARNTISLNRSANATPTSAPAANGHRSTINAAATTHAAASVRGYTVLPKPSGIQCVAKSSAATSAARSCRTSASPADRRADRHAVSAMNGSGRKEDVARVGQASMRTKRPAQRPRPARTDCECPTGVSRAARAAKRLGQHLHIVAGHEAEVAIRQPDLRDWQPRR